MQTRRTFMQATALAGIAGIVASGIVIVLLTLGVSAGVSGLLER